jgi:hypothetical protein
MKLIHSLRVGQTPLPPPPQEKLWVCLWPARHSVTLPAGIFEMTKCILTRSLSDLRQNGEAVLKTFDLFIYGDVRCVTNVTVCKNVLKIATH